MEKAEQGEMESEIYTDGLENSATSVWLNHRNLRYYTYPVQQPVFRKRNGISHHNRLEQLGDHENGLVWQCTRLGATKPLFETTSTTEMNKQKADS